MPGSLRWDKKGGHEPWNFSEIYQDGISLTPRSAIVQACSDMRTAILDNRKSIKAKDQEVSIPYLKSVENKIRNIETAKVILSISRDTCEVSHSFITIFSFCKYAANVINRINSGSAHYAIIEHGRQGGDRLYRRFGQVHGGKAQWPQRD